MSNSAIKSARRVLEILEYFEEHRRPLSLKDISDGLGYPISSASGLLKSLVVLGYLDYDRYSLTYMPTTRVCGLGSWIPQALFGDGPLLGMLAKLHEMTDETVVLGVQSDLHAQYVHVLPSGRPRREHLKPGTIRPLARSGIGLALLSLRTNDVIDTLVRRINIRESAVLGKLSIPEVLREVEAVRRNGFAFSKGRCVPHRGMVAMVLPVMRNVRHLAIGIGGPIDHLEANLDLLLEEMSAGVREAENFTKGLPPTHVSSPERVQREYVVH